MLTCHLHPAPPLPQGFVCAKLSGVERAPEFGALMLDAMKRAWIGAAATSNKDSAVLDVLVDILKQLKVGERALLERVKGAQHSGSTCTELGDDVCMPISHGGQPECTCTACRELTTPAAALHH